MEGGTGGGKDGGGVFLRQPRDATPHGFPAYNRRTFRLPGVPYAESLPLRPRAPRRPDLVRRRPGDPLYLPVLGQQGRELDVSASSRTASGSSPMSTTTADGARRPSRTSGSARAAFRSSADHRPRLLEDPGRRAVRVAGGKASWKSAAEKGERELREPAFFLSPNVPPQDDGPAGRRPLLPGPGRKLALLPDGEARIEKLGSKTGPGPAASRDRPPLRALRPGLHARSTSGSTPEGAVRLGRRLGGDLPRGVGGRRAELTKVQDAAETARQKDLAATLAHQPQGRARHPPRPALRSRDRRSSRHHRGRRRQPHPGGGQGRRGGGARRRRGDRRRGARRCCPGLWDMHVHLADDRTGCSTSPPASPPCATWPTTSTSSRTCAEALGFRRGHRPARADGRLHRRPRPLRRPHQGPGVDRAGGRWSGSTATPSSATCRSSSTARSIRSWCRRSSSAPTSWACASPATSPTA